jgi:CheY-like chemotaxis protein
MSQASKAPSRKVLFVDGEALLRDVYVEEAKRVGLTPLVAPDSDTAWDLFETEQPDVLVTDLDVPGSTSGEELVARVRQTPLGAVIPVVAVSPGKREIRGVTDAVIRHGVDDFLEKPVHGERLLWRIRELIEGRPIGLGEGASAAEGQLERAVVLSRATDFMQGKLEEADVAPLFFSFFATGRSGKLCVMEGKQVIQIWFRRGWPLFAESNIPGMEFGDWLVSRGRVRADALLDARQEWEQVDRSLGVLLVARGVLAAGTLFNEMRANTDAVLNKLFGWSEGHFYVEYEAPGVDLDIPELVSLQRSPAHYVVTGIRDRYDRERCEAILRTAQGPLVVSPSAHFILRELEDPYYYENVLASLGDGATAPKLLAMHPFDRDDRALGAVTALWVVGGVLEQVTELDVAAAHRSQAGSRSERIRRAVASVAAQEHPEAKAARRARIRERLDRRQRRREEKKAERRQSGVASIMNALDRVSSEVAFDNGCRLLAVGEIEEAIASLEEAIAKSPSSATYYSVLGQAYLARERVGPTELSQAFHTLKKGAALDPQNGEPYHWLGMVLMRMGHPDEARITLRRSIELGSPHIEETRTLLASLR